VISLKARGLTAERALRCCRYQSLRQQQIVSYLLGEILDATLSVRNDGATNAAIAIVPTPGVKVPAPGVATATEFERLLQKGTPTDFQRLLREPFKPTFKVVRVIRGGPLVLGAVVLLGATALSSLTSQLATLETLTGVVELVDKIRDTQDCEGCIRRAIWGQKNRQIRKTGYTRRRENPSRKS